MHAPCRVTNVDYLVGTCVAGTVKLCLQRGVDCGSCCVRVLVCVRARTAAQDTQCIIPNRRIRIYEICIRNVPQIGQHTYLTADFSLRCDTPTWRYWAGIAGAAFVVYVIGVPVLFYTIVRRARGANVARYLAIMRPFLVSIARANRLAAAAESIDAAGPAAKKLLQLRSAAAAAAGATTAFTTPEAKSTYLRFGRSEHVKAVARARRDIRTAMGHELALRHDDLMREAVSIVRDAAAVQSDDVSLAGRHADSTDDARLMRRMAGFLGEDNLGSTWVSQRCIFENYQRKYWWFENVSLPP
jgi:hypothetical protein